MASRKRSTRATRARSLPLAERPDASEDVFSPNPQGVAAKAQRGRPGPSVGHRTAAKKKPGVKVPRRGDERGFGKFARETMKTGRTSGSAPRAAQKTRPRKSVAAKRAAKGAPTLPPPEEKVIDKRLKSGHWRPTSRYSEGR